MTVLQCPGLAPEKPACSSGRRSRSQACGLPWMMHPHTLLFSAFLLVSAAHTSAVSVCAHTYTYMCFLSLKSLQISALDSHSWEYFG